MPGAAKKSYQRLEFLGDRILNLSIAYLLTIKNPDASEETLQTDYQPLVENDGVILLQVGRYLSLERYLIKGRGETYITNKIYADAIEALLGAIYLDSNNINAVIEIVKSLWMRFSPLVLSPNEIMSAESATKENDNFSSDDDVINEEEKLETLNLNSTSDDESKASYFPNIITDHFEGGTYIFKKEILSWTLDNLGKLPYTFRISAPIPKHGVYNISSKLQYYENFKPLILEEVRTILAEKYQDVLANKIPPITASVKKFKEAKNPYNPSILHLKSSLPNEYQEGSSEIAVILEPDHPQHKTQYLGIAEYTDPPFDPNISADDNVRMPMNKHSSEKKTLGAKRFPHHTMQTSARDKIFTVKFVSQNQTILSNNKNHRNNALKSTHHSNTSSDDEIDISITNNNSDIYIYNNDFFNPDYPWKMYILDSIITYQRMYEVCTIARPIALLKTLITGQLSKLPRHVTNISPELDPLNEFQKLAAAHFLNLNKGIQLLQGPPGTGKTTTLVTLLKALITSNTASTIESKSTNQPANRKILVCAPSNKAIQVLAQKFINLMPEVPVMYIGVDNKVPKELADIFFNTWIRALLDKLDNLNNTIFKTLKSLNVDIEKLTKKQSSSTASKKLMRFIRNDISKILAELENIILNVQRH